MRIVWHFDLGLICWLTTRAPLLNLVCSCLMTPLRLSRLALVIIWTLTMLSTQGNRTEGAWTSPLWRALADPAWLATAMLALRSDWIWFLILRCRLLRLVKHAAQAIYAASLGTMLLVWSVCFSVLTLPWDRFGDTCLVQVVSVVIWCRVEGSRTA